MSREQALETSFAKIRGLLSHEVRYEDPECCLFSIAEIVQEMIGDRLGIAPDEEGTEGEA